MPKGPVSPVEVGYQTAKKLLKKKSIKKIIDKWESMINANISHFSIARHSNEYVQFREGFQKAIEEHNDEIMKRK